MTIRPVRPDDADGLVAHVRAIVAEPVATAPIAPDEVRTPEGRRRAFVREGDAYLDDLLMARLL